MGRSSAKIEVGGRGRNHNDCRNYEGGESKTLMKILWHSVRLTWNSVDLHRKYTRQTQDGWKRPIIRPQPDPCPPLPGDYNFCSIPMLNVYFWKIHEMFEIGGGMGAFLYAKNTTLCITFLYTKIRTLCVTRLYKNYYNYIDVGIVILSCSILYC